MISSELRLLSRSIAETTVAAIDQGKFSDLAADLIPLQMQLIHFAQRDVVGNYLLDAENDWPWAKQPTPQ